MKHNWVFVGTETHGKCTEFLFRCSNLGCIKFASFEMTTKSITSKIVKECMKKINHTETRWDICGNNQK